MRDWSEWGEAALPELAIIDRKIATAVDSGLAKRSTHAAERRGNGKCERHLLPGLIKYAECGSNITNSWKGYYLCAGANERGACSSKAAIRVAPPREGVLGVLQKKPLTADMAEMSVPELRREPARLLKSSSEADRAAERRLRATETELATLSGDLTAGVVGLTSCH